MNDHKASLLYLKPKIDFSKGEDSEWILVRTDVLSDSAQYELYLEKELTVKNSLGKYIHNLPDRERLSFGYVANIKQLLSFVMNDSLWRKGAIDSSFMDLIKSGDYFISRKGLEFLKAQIKDDQIDFAFGKYIDKEIYYLICYDPIRYAYTGDDLKYECRKFEESKDEAGFISYSVDCPGFEFMDTPILCDKDIFNLEISADLLIE